MLLVVLLLLTAATGWCAAPSADGTNAQLDAAARLIKAGDWAKAEQSLQGILRANPKQPDALNLLGIAAAKQGRLEEAEALFRRAIAAQPRMPASYGNLAQLLQQKGERERAVQTLREGLSHAPGDAPLLQQLAVSLADGGDF